MDAGKYASACPKLEEVTRLIPDGIGAKLTLGECYENLGKLASAWSQCAIAASLAAHADQPDRLKEANACVDRLKPRLATLAIEVAQSLRSIADLTIVRDNLSIGAAQWGTAVPVDSGVHEIVVTAPGYRTWKKHVEILADGVSAKVSVSALEVDPTTDRPGKADHAPGQSAPSWDRTWQRPVGLASMATGVLGLSAGAVLGALAIAKRDESNQNGHCDAHSTCDGIGLNLRDEAVGLGDASTTAFVVGGAVLGGGILIFATAPRSNGKPKAAIQSKLAAGVRVTPGRLTLTGQW